MGSNRFSFSDSAHHITNRFALFASCSELGGKASGIIRFRVYGHGHFRETGTTGLPA